MTKNNDPRSAHEDWPMPTSEEMEWLRTAKDGLALQQGLADRLRSEGSKGVLSKAGCALLKAAHEAGEKMKGSPAFYAQTDRNWLMPTKDEIDGASGDV